MEKPASYTEYFAARSRYNTEDEQERAAHQARLRMSRDIPTLSDRVRDSEESVWKGDHSFSSEAASYSLMNFIEPEIAVQHPDWEKEKVRREARMRFASRLEQDLSYEHKERGHQETVVSWHPVVNQDGETELATEYGDGYITLRELWEHTKEYAEFVGNSAAYNPEEARAQLVMQEQFLAGGATGFVSVLSHPESVRYVQIWEKGSDGGVTSKQIDLFVSTGRDFSKTEGDELVRSLATYYHGVKQGGDTSMTYEHFFVQQLPVREDRIRTIATAVAMKYEYSGKAPTRLVADKGPGTDRVYARPEPAVTYFDPAFDRQIERIRAAGGAVSPEKHVKHPGHRLPDKNMHSQHHHTPDAAPGMPAHRGMLRIQDALVSWQISKTILSYVDDLPVAPYAFFYWNAVIGAPHAQTGEGMKGRAADSPIVQPENPQKHGSTEAHNPPGLRAGIASVRRIFVRAWAVMMRKTERPPAPDRKNPRPDREKQDADAGREVAARNRREPSQGAPHVHISLRRWVQGIHVRMYEMFRRIRRKPEVHGDVPPVETSGYANPEHAGSRDVKDTDTYRETQTEIRGTRAIGGLGAAFFFWYVCTRPDVSGKKKQSSAVGDQQQEEPVRHALLRTPWVLFAIIRYLALVQEAGLHAGNSSPVHARGQRKRRKRRVFQQFPITSSGRNSRSVIFTFAS